MMKSKINIFHISLWLFICVAFTFLVKFVDVKIVGPLEAKVGFATINVFFKNKLSFSELFYNISKYIGILFIILSFAVCAIVAYQVIIARKIKRRLFFLAIIFVIVYFLYFIFEFIVINYRPILMEPSIEELEASFPSSHTMIALTVFGGLSIYFSKKRTPLKYLAIIFGLLAIVEIIFRFLSGVHWFTDIIGGILYGTLLLVIYSEVIKK